MFRDSQVLVTGGAGSFGQAFVHAVLEHGAARVCIYSRDEWKHAEMAASFDDDRLRFFIGDVRDLPRLTRAMHGIDYVVHAAALKRVPEIEYNVFEAIKTNIVGSMNTLEAAIEADVQRVMLISTDKAVAPTNAYGATKMCAEKLFVSGNAYSRGPRFSCVRYGNVVGSRGSVIPLFQRQKEDGTLTLTDPRMTRFWLTLDQGVEFVMDCMAVMRGGEIFVPRIPSVGLLEIADALAGDCDERYSGIRPGEKLHETLISEDEARHTVTMASGYVIEPVDPQWAYEPWDGERLADGWTYRSDTNEMRLGPEDVRKWLP